MSIKFEDNITPLNAENLNRVVDLAVDAGKSAQDGNEFVNSLFQELVNVLGQPITFDEFVRSQTTFNEFVAKNKTFVKFAMQGLN